jgi:hypothetical protein
MINWPKVNSTRSSATFELINSEVRVETSKSYKVHTPALVISTKFKAATQLLKQFAS